MTKHQLEIIQHSLGADEHGRPPQGRSDFYRNHFCAGGDDVAACEELVALGYAEKFERSFLPYFNITITQDGIAAMRRESPKPPKLSRSQKRYRAFLDCDNGMKFGEWLKVMRA